MTTLRNPRGLYTSSRDHMFLWLQRKFEYFCYRLLGPSTIHLQYEIALWMSCMLLVIGSFRGLYKQECFDASSADTSNATPSAALWVQPCSGSTSLLLCVGCILARHGIYRWLCTWDASTMRSPSLQGLCSRIVTTHLSAGHVWDRPATSYIHHKWCHVMLGMTPPQHATAAPAGALGFQGHNINQSPQTTLSALLRGKNNPSIKYRMVVVLWQCARFIVGLCPSTLFYAMQIPYVRLWIPLARTWHASCTYREQRQAWLRSKRFHSKFYLPPNPEGESLRSGGTTQHHHYRHGGGSHFSPSTGGAGNNSSLTAGADPDSILTATTGAPSPSMTSSSRRGKHGSSSHYNHHHHHHQNHQSYSHRVNHSTPVKFLVMMWGGIKSLVVMTHQLGTRLVQLLTRCCLEHSLSLQFLLSAFCFVVYFSYFLIQLGMDSAGAAMPYWMFDQLLHGFIHRGSGKGHHATSKNMVWSMLAIDTRNTRSGGMWEEHSTSKPRGAYTWKGKPDVLDIFMVFSTAGVLLSILFFARVLLPMPDAVASSGSVWRDLRKHDAEASSLSALAGFSPNAGTASASGSTNSVYSWSFSSFSWLRSWLDLGTSTSSSNSNIGGGVSSRSNVSASNSASTGSLTVGIKNLQEMQPWPERVLCLAAEHRVEMTLQVVLFRLLENIVVVAILPRTYFVCRAIGHCPAGTSLWEVSQILSPVGASWAYRMDGINLFHFMESDLLSALWTFIGVVSATSTLLLAQWIHFSRSYLATWSYLTTAEWTRVHPDAVAAMAASGTLHTVSTWDPRRKYKQGDLIIHPPASLASTSSSPTSQRQTQFTASYNRLLNPFRRKQPTVFRATTNAPNGKPFDQRWSFVQDHLRSELGHPSTSFLILKLATFQCYVVGGFALFWLLWQALIPPLAWASIISAENLQSPWYGFVFALLSQVIAAHVLLYASGSLLQRHGREIHALNASIWARATVSSQHPIPSS